MVDEFRTGSVRAGNIVGKVNVGVTISADDADVVNAALAQIKRLQTGSVIVGGTISGDVNTGIKISAGLRHVDPENPTIEALVAELRQLREELAGAEFEDGPPREVEEAVKSLDVAAEEAGKEQPLARVVVARVKEAVEFLTDAGKAVEQLGKAGAVVANALPTALALYEAATRLFGP
jgi:hypothetical protein